MMIDEPRHNPERSQTQCNFILKTILSPERRLVGYVACPKDVWAEYRMLITSPIFDITTEGIQARIQNTEIPQGWYCPNHFFHMLRSARSRYHSHP